jgi:hypothetical protein
LEWGLGRMISGSTIHMGLHKPNNKFWLVCSCSTFGAQTSHGHTRTHKIHHVPDLGEATTFPLKIFFVLGHGATPNCHFVPGLSSYESQNSRN